MAIPHQKFLSFSPTLHEVCSSHFINDYWILLIKQVEPVHVNNDWRSEAPKKFQLLSELCQLANETIHDAIRRFITQPFIVSILPNEMDFKAQLDTAVDQFSQSTFDYFNLLVSTADLLTQVDQPYKGRAGLIINSAPMLIFNNITNKKTNSEPVQVSDYSN
jgi:hypothetical protein